MVLQDFCLVLIKDFKDIKYEATSVPIKGLYIQKHLSQSVAVCGKLEHGRPRQSQVQPGTVLKVPSCAIFSKDVKDFKDIKYNTERPQKVSQKSVPKMCPKKCPKNIYVDERSG